MAVVPDFVGSDALRFGRKSKLRTDRLQSQGTTLRIEAGWPGSLNRLPVSVTFVPSTLRIELSSSYVRFGWTRSLDHLVGVTAHRAALSHHRFRVQSRKRRENHCDR